MRQYAWYSPEFNVIILQCIVEDREICFEWDWWDICKLKVMAGEIEDPMRLTGWIPLGEL